MCCAALGCGANLTAAVANLGSPIRDPRRAPNGGIVTNRKLADIVKDQKPSKPWVGTTAFRSGSGHGVGKTTLEAWLILWFLLTDQNCKIPVAANSQDQLLDIIWPEIGKWHRQLPEALKQWLTCRQNASSLYKIWRAHSP